ncbi:MAG: hypothetical protein KGJ89_01755 [Patescibacteria group bacterium]|nr:hypothetical protein [Patescibacteria group bacterium]MDE2015602.1 hypothetical protein [Patescibacteria group bacterium]MDE2226659.1 hypothetical protein [Patescibacteria group bacterium]
MKIIKDPIKRNELAEMARVGFGDIVKAVVDIKQEIMAVGGELHADEEVLLSEQQKSGRENTWGINLYPEISGEEWIEFDSMINLKPAAGNRSRGVEDINIQKKIREIVGKLIEE